ncbi:uncharacterized protein RJT21DRAFT_141826 [Scheffersomyces amazonensis]|uniref:uncharacterized protein n=1 Tax=Scheffersomyces amazonensis TaxID=1078765 RepID=UPI00315D8054
MRFYLLLYTIVFYVVVESSSANQSQLFYLAAYKPAHDISSDIDLRLSVQIQQLESVGYQIVVYDANDLKSIGLSPNIDSSKYNVTGYINANQSLIVSSVEDNSVYYLVVDPQTSRLELSTVYPSGENKFALTRNLITYNNQTTWSVCSNKNSTGLTDSIYIGTLAQNGAFCSNDGRELNLKAIGFLTGDGTLPDYPLK